MEFTTLKTTDTNEFVRYMYDGDFGTVTVPKLMSPTMTSELFWKYIQEESGSKILDLEELQKVYKLVKITINETEI